MNHFLVWRYLFVCKISIRNITLILLFDDIGNVFDHLDYVCVLENMWKNAREIK